MIFSLLTYVKLPLPPPLQKAVALNPSFCCLPLPLCHTWSSGSDLGVLIFLSQASFVCGCSPKWLAR